MYCPNCGNKTSTDQNFCRACGLGLEKIALSLTEQLPTKPDRGLQEQKERLQKLGMGTLGVFVLGILTFIAYSVAYKLIISKGDLLTGLAMIGFVIMIACGIASVVFFAKANELGPDTKRKPQELSHTGSTKELSEGHFEPVPSVTDRTTELLTVERDKNSRA